MNAKAPGLDARFVQEQRDYLLRLRQALLTLAQHEDADAESLQSESQDRPREREEEAQMLQTLDVDGSLVAYDFERLQRVNRALEKVEAGTYGVSDLSGEPIPHERLEAVPEAIYTLEEEEAIERRQQRPV
jgi:DnaK suppressor protein